MEIGTTHYQDSRSPGKSGSWGDREKWGNFVGSSLENNVHHPYTVTQFLSNWPLMKLLFVGSGTKNRMFGHCWKWISLTKRPWCPSCPYNNVKVVREHVLPHLLVIGHKSRGF